MSVIRRISVLSHCNDLGGKVWNPAIRWTQKYSVFVVLEDDEGRSGVGECWCFDTAPDTLVAFLKTEVVLHFLGINNCYVQEVSKRLLDMATLTARHGILASALSGIDIAMWDLRGQRERLPIWKCLNPQGPGDVHLYASGGLYGRNKNIPDLQAEMAGLASNRFQLLKMKIGALDIADDIARVLGVIKTLPEEVNLIIDGVYSYNPDDALRVYEALPGTRIEAFQSPVKAHDLQGMATLSKAGVPVMATEAEYRIELHERLVQDVEIAFLQTAPIACGGISRVEELKDLVRGTSTQLSLEISSTAIALMAACQIAASDDIIAHVEHHYVHQVFFDDLKFTPDKADRQRFSFPDTPGLGVSLVGKDVKHHFNMTRSRQTQEPKSAAL